MFLAVGPINNVDVKWQEFRELHTKLTNSVPPVIAVVDGPTYIVIVEGIYYPVSTILDSVNLLVKIFFVYNLSYPKQSVEFYTFVQEYFYYIRSESLTSELTSVLNEWKA